MSFVPFFVSLCEILIYNMKVFIEQIDDQFRGANEYIAFRGFESLGYEICPFVAADVESLALDAATPVVAGIPTIWRALKTLGAAPPQLEPVPRGLEGFAGREFGLSTLDKIRVHVVEEKPPIFIKPIVGKLFDGHVARGFRDLIRTSGLAPQTAIWWSEVVEFRGEYRGYVCNGELVGFGHYKGDFRLTVDFAPVDAALKSWEELPRGCSMDWGVTADGRTLLIEVNDGYSLGCYGLLPVTYANLLASRWSELANAHP